MNAISNYLKNLLPTNRTSKPSSVEAVVKECLHNNNSQILCRERAGLKHEDIISYQDFKAQVVSFSKSEIKKLQSCVQDKHTLSEQDLQEAQSKEDVEEACKRDWTRCNFGVNGQPFQEYETLVCTLSSLLKISELPEIHLHWVLSQISQNTLQKVVAKIQPSLPDVEVMEPSLPVRYKCLNINIDTSGSQCIKVCMKKTMQIAKIDSWGTPVPGALMEICVMSDLKQRDAQPGEYVKSSSYECKVVPCHKQFTQWEKQLPQLNRVN